MATTKGAKAPTKKKATASETHDPRVDVYIERAADFAKPILRHVRKLAHDACPGIVETIKWGMPSFEHHGIVCNMAAFKAHCAMNLWHATRLEDGPGSGYNNMAIRGGMGVLGRITSRADLPSDPVLTRWIRDTARLNEEGVKAPKKKAAPKKALAVPPVMKAALAKNAKAKRAFEAFTDAQRREYITWIADAKSDATRDRRLTTAIGWIAEGKTRNWQYEKKK